MLRIGITGGIGSGKSTIAKVFETLGVPVYYADEAAKWLMENNDALKESIQQHFGEKVYVDGKLNRALLASLVFSQPEQLAALNHLVHPATMADAARWMQQQTAPYVLKEAALLFESGSSADLDYVIGVTAPEALRIKRAMQRDGVTRDEVLKRMRNQIEEHIKMRLCDFVIQNDEQSLVVPKVIALHEQILSLAKTHPAA